jgi:hypothetical protein
MGHEQDGAVGWAGERSGAGCYKYSESVDKSSIQTLRHPLSKAAADCDSVFYMGAGY